ncbi:MAG: putative lipid II flippase FtsW [Planctomycetota bacterium]|jgi:cell division protein FtsW
MKGLFDQAFADPTVADGPDKAVFTAVAAVGLLTVLGLVMVYSASALPGALPGGYGEFLYLRKQVFFLLVALGGFALAYRMPRPWLERSGYVAFGVAMLGLILALIPAVGHEVNGARRWIRFGPFGIQISDMAKIALILFASQHLGRSRERAASFKRGALPLMGAVGALAALVVVEPDFGTALFIVLLGGVLAVAGGVRWFHLAPPLAVGLPVMVFLVWQKFDHVRDRIAVFLDPSLDPLGKGHQVRQSLIALGSGGALGRGLGAGRQKLFFLPENFTDFILSLVGEEMGLAGTLLVLACFLAFLLASVSIARRARTGSDALIALGVGILVSLQGFINIAVVTASVPTKGISLPFVSYGGSSLVAMMIGLGLLLNVARRVTGEGEGAVAPAPALLARAGAG